MIFKQVDEILSGRKTKARWVVRPGQMLCDSPFRYTDTNEDGIEFLTQGVYKVTWGEGQESFDDGDGECKDLRLIYGIGRTYAVAPALGEPGVWWCQEGEFLLWRLPTNDEKPRLLEDGWQALRIRITAIRRERLQDISEADARAEGVESVEAYRALWDSINTRKGTRWQDCPDVWVLSFEVVREGSVA